MTQANNSLLKSILSLLAVAVVCIGLIFGAHMLFPKNERSMFYDVAAGTYESEPVDFDIYLVESEVLAVAFGTLEEGGAEVIGLSVMAYGVGVAHDFTILIVIERETGIIVGIEIAVDGTSEGYNYVPGFEANVKATLIGKKITSVTASDVLVTKATNSSNTVERAIRAAADYYAEIK